MRLLIIALQFFASLTILVMIHEMGHFLMAKLFKVRVEKFYLFFNPFFSLFKFKPKRSETTYGLGWLPLGGYVKLSGMVDESMDTEQMKNAPQPWEFRTKPAWQRLIIIVMGVVFNFLLALVIYTSIAFHYGEQYIPLQSIKAGLEFSDVAKKAGFRDGDILLRADDKCLVKADENTFRTVMESKRIVVMRDGEETEITLPDDFMMQVIEGNSGVFSFRYPFVIDRVMDGSRAERAGLLAGDSLVGVSDSLTPAYVSTCVKIFAEHRNDPLLVRVSRNEEIVDVQVTPDVDGRIGVYMKPISSFYQLEKESYGLLESVSVGVKRGFGRLFNYAGDMKYVFTKAGAQSVGGFMSIGSLFPYPFNAYAFWEMTAFLSVILAFMNILPIPALDGGHAVFILYEMIFRRKPSQNVVVKAQMIGMFLLLLLFVYANVNDLFRFLG